MVKWRRQKSYKDVIAYDLKWKETKVSFFFCNMGDVNESVNNCGLSIIVESALYILVEVSFLKIPSATANIAMHCLKREGDTKPMGTSYNFDKVWSSAYDVRFGK